MALNINVSRNWSDYECTSVSSNNITTGTLSFTTQTGKAWVATDDIALVPNSKIPMMLIGTVTSYNSATGALVVSINRMESQIPSWDLVSASAGTTGTGSKTFITYNGKSSLLGAGDSIQVRRRGTNAHIGYTAATVTSYNNANGTLVINATGTNGTVNAVTDWIIVSAGTSTAWNIVPSPIAIYQVGGASVFTIDKEPLYPVGSFSALTQGKIVLNNQTNDLWVINLGSKSTNTAKLFNAEVNGELNLTGKLIEVGTGAGVAGQTIDLSAYPKLDMPAIQIAGRPWYIFEDSAVDRGYVGLNWLSRGFSFSYTSKNATVTMTTASPTVVTWNSHGLKIGQRVIFTTTGTYTGITTGTAYSIIPTDFTANSFKISTAVATLPAINVTAQSGTHTCYALPDFGSGVQGNVLLYNPTTKILTCGDGTIGNVIPNGEKIYMPNVNFTMEYPRAPLMSAISSATAGNAISVLVGNSTNIITTTGMPVIINKEEFVGTVTSGVLATSQRATNGTITANHAQGDTLYSQLGTTNRGLIDLADGGKMTTNLVSFSGIYLNMTAYQTLSITNTWVCGGCAFGSSTADAVVNGLFNSPYPTLDAGGLTINSNLGSLDTRRLFSANTAFAGNTAPQPILLANNQNIIRAEDFESYVTHRNGNAQPAAIFFNTNSINCTPKRLTVIGGRIHFSASSNFEVEELYIGAESNGLTVVSSGTTALNIQNCQNAIFRNINKTVNGSAHRSAVFSTDANCSNILFHTIDYDGQSHCGQIAVAPGNSIKVANGVFGAFRDGSSSSGGAWTISNNATSDGAIMQNCIFTLSDTYGADNGLGISARCFADCVSGYSMWWRATSAFASNYQEMGPFHVLLDAGKASGALYYTPSVKASRDIYTLSGDAYFNNSGSLILPTSGDYAIIKSYQVLRTITGFSGVVDPEDINNANLTYEFELVNYDGAFTGSWTSLTTENLSSALSAITGYDDIKGFHIRLKITATTSDDTNRVINIRMFTTNNASAVLPIGFTEYTITNLSADTTIGIFDGTTEVEYDNGASGSSVEHLPYDFDGNDKTLAVKLRCYTCTWDEHNVIFDQYALSYVSKQTADSNITEPTKATVAAYTTLETPAKLYDYCKYWGTLRANLLTPMLCTKSGSALNFGAYDLVIDDTSSLPLALVGNTITIKASAINGGSITTTGTIALSGTSTTGTTLLSGSNGASGLIQINGLASTAVYVKDDAGDEFDYEASITGTYEITLPFGSSGDWTVVTKRVGYRHAYYNFTADAGGIFASTPSMPQKLNPDGTAMYLGESSLLASVDFDGATQASLYIGNGEVTLQEAHDETEDALVTNDGMIWLAGGKSDCSQFNSVGGDYFFMSTGWRLRRDSVGDANATLNAFAISADGVVVDGVNGGVQFLTSDSPTTIAQAVRTALATELARIDVAISTRNDVSPDNAGIEAIKERTDNLPDFPASRTDTIIASQL